MALKGVIKGFELGGSGGAGMPSRLKLFGRCIRCTCNFMRVASRLSKLTLFFFAREFIVDTQCLHMYITFECHTYIENSAYDAHRHVVLFFSNCRQGVTRWKGVYN